MMKKIYYSGIFLIIFILSSCTITQEFYFNKDFSGTYTSTIDMSELIKAMNTNGKEDKSFTDSLNLMLKQTEEKMKGTGISNLKSGWKNDKILFISYDFSNIDVLNKALNNSGISDNNAPTGEDFVFFTLKRKTLTYHGIPPKETAEGGKDLGAMKDYYKYKAIFSFERKIKKADNPKYKISEDKHKAEMTAPLFDITKPDFNSKIKFKLK
jgi:hypothetical protein